MPFIQVAVDVPLPTLFDYRTSAVSQDDVGRRVCVPFGRKRMVGIIMGIVDRPAIDDAKVKSAGEILRDLPPVPPDVLELLRFCSSYYHHSIGEVAAAALPARFRTSRKIAAEQRFDIEATAAGQAASQAGIKRSPVLASVLRSLCEASVLSANEIEARPPNERRALKRLLEKGWAIERTAAAQATPRSVGTAPGKPELTPEQQAAVAAITQAPMRFKTWLLHGITGSGKTEVYLRAMEAVLDGGGQVLMLVPEIGLTPQLEARIRSRFSAWTTVTMHSGLAAGERVRNWLAAHSGMANIVVGTRSAIFTPMPRLALIVVDEEHDASYKQIESMRYSARDLAVWRGRQCDVPVVLGSATPSLESYHAAVRGRYALLRLTRRANDAPLPAVRMISTPEKSAAAGLSSEVLAAIRDRLARNEQVLVYINRRGYAPVLICGACAWAPSCHRCSARLVLHKPQSRLICHHCGHSERVPGACPSCGNVDLYPLGHGTQRIETTLQAALPNARILRIDRDTTRIKTAWPRMRAAIERGEVDILVGTQMLAKGHDFPGLGLVCVLNADQSLFSTDFRASEHLFAQLSQVAGRAGRARIAGEVLIQTQFPAHPLYRAVQAHDYTGFAQALLEEREHARFPPFVHQAVLRAEASKLEHALSFLGHAARLASDCAEGIDVFDPTPAAMERLKGRERAQLLVQSRRRALLHAFLNRWTQRLAQSRAYGARWTIDVDPVGI